MTSHATTAMNSQRYAWTGNLLVLGLWALYLVFVNGPVFSYVCNVSNSLSGFGRGAVQVLYYSVLGIAIFRTMPCLPGLRAKGNLVLVFLVGAVYLLQQFGFEGLMSVKSMVESSVGPGTAGFWWILGCYVLLLSIPFVPGIELGLILMIMFGREGIVAVYLATVLGLLIPYILGSAIPLEVFQRVLSSRADPETVLLNTNNGHGLFQRIINSAMGARLLQYKPIILAVAFNFPCNSVVGGGGSIALMSGISRFVPLKSYLLVITLATAPIPLLAFAGMIHLESLLAINVDAQLLPNCPAPR